MTSRPSHRHTDTWRTNPQGTEASEEAGCGAATGRILAGEEDGDRVLRELTFRPHHDHPGHPGHAGQHPYGTVHQRLLAEP